MTETSAIRKSAILLCIVGFGKELRPTTAYLTPYLIEAKNVSDTELYSQVYPYSTYSYMVALLPIFVVTDLVRYKPIIILEVAMLIGVWCMLIWSKSIALLQLMQVNNFYTLHNKCSLLISGTFRRCNCQ